MDVQGHDCSIVNVCSVTCIEGIALREVQGVKHDSGAGVEGEADLCSAGGRECDACERDKNYRDCKKRAYGSVDQLY